MVPVLAAFRKIKRIQAPGTVDGGDVLQVGKHFLIGLSQRTNKDGYLLTPAGFPDTRTQLEVLGFKIIELETSEVHKMDGGLTCMSIRF